MRSSLAILLLLLTGCAHRSPGLPASPQSLHLEPFGDARKGDVRTLIIVLHGDAAPGARTDEYAFAEAAGRAVPESAVLAILRPGYDDSRGHRSPGNRGTGVGDDYARTQISDIATLVEDLQGRHPGTRTIVVGDGGGAALAANIAGLYPTLFDGMVLVGCPCTLPEWRTHMAATSANPGWKTPVTSLDPLQTAGGVRTTTRAAILVGADDAVTPVAFSRAYAEALTLRGVATDYRIVPGKGHDLLGDPEVLAATVRLAATLPGKRP